MFIHSVVFGKPFGSRVRHHDHHHLIRVRRDVFQRIITLQKLQTVIPLTYTHTHVANFLFIQ